jgi:DNA mismatch endonuclease, patch repair protein
MARVKGKDTTPEMVVRRLVHGMGYRYRLHVRKLPGCPDLVFTRRLKVIYVHGCFWHRHPDPGCRLARLPKSRLDFWSPKLEANRDRDIRNLAEIGRLGWKALVVWECELRDLPLLAERMRNFLEDVE